MNITMVKMHELEDYETKKKKNMKNM